MRYVLHYKLSAQVKLLVFEEKGWQAVSWSFKRESCPIWNHIFVELEYILPYLSMQYHQNTSIQVCFRRAEFDVHPWRSFLLGKTCISRRNGNLMKNYCNMRKNLVALDIQTSADAVAFSLN